MYGIVAAQEMLFKRKLRSVSGLIALSLIGTAKVPSAWESPARLRHGLVRASPGVLRVNSQGLEFSPLKGPAEHWTLIQIRTLDLESHRVVLTGYENRAWHVPGTRQFDFELKEELTPAVAAALADKVSHPVRNRIPNPQAPAVAEIAARQSEHFGGSNGLLRLRQQGIDYVTTRSGESRSWRWVDLQTLSNPDPLHLLVFGYRDTYAFDLKEPLPREVFNHLSDEIWLHQESETGDGAPVTLAPGASTNREERR